MHSLLFILCMCVWRIYIHLILWYDTYWRKLVFDHQLANNFLLIFKLCKGDFRMGRCDEEYLEGFDMSHYISIFIIFFILFQVGECPLPCNFYSKYEKISMSQCPSYLILRGQVSPKERIIKKDFYVIFSCWWSIKGSNH